MSTAKTKSQKSKDARESEHRAKLERFLPPAGGVWGMIKLAKEGKDFELMAINDDELEDHFHLVADWYSDQELQPRRLAGFARALPVFTRDQLGPLVASMARDLFWLLGC